MNFGVKAFATGAKANLERRDRLERVAALGFDGVELCVDDPLDLDSIREISRLLARLGLRATVAGSWDASVRLDEHVCRLLDACALLDADTLCGTFRFSLNPAGIAALSTVAHYASLLGITLALGGRDDVRPRACTVAEASRLVDAVGSQSLGIAYNTYQAHVQESSISAAILSAGKRIRYVQIADNDQAVPGSGQVGWSETFAALEAIEYDGWYVIDADRDQDVERFAVGGLEFLRRGLRRTA